MQPVQVLLLLLLLQFLMGPCRTEDALPTAHIARCPSNPLDDGFCECGFRHGILSIKCDFNHAKDVKLTENLYAFSNTSMKSAYVRITNAKSVHVTSAFMKAWLGAPSSALDIWRGGHLTLEPTPVLDNLHKFSIYQTFVGVGIINCDIPLVPKYFLRDRNRGAFKVKGSRVGTLQSGMISNIKEMRYMVMANSEITLIERDIALPVMTLSRRAVHSWNGLVLSNVTVNTIAPSAFNITHETDVEIVSVKDSVVGEVGSQGLTVTGDIAVTIMDNKFALIRAHAMKVKVTGELRFTNNVIRSWEEDALDGLMCSSTHTYMDHNTLHLSEFDERPNSLFHSSCGAPQVFYEIEEVKEIKKIWPRGWTALIVVLVIVVLVVVVAGGIWLWRMKLPVMRRHYRRGDTPLYSETDQHTGEDLQQPEAKDPDPGSREPKNDYNLPNDIYDIKSLV